MMEQNEEQTVCRMVGCGRPVEGSQRWEWIGLCEDHIELFDTRVELEQWELTQKILRPWVESAEVINDCLAKAMNHALSETEGTIEVLRERMERLEAVL